MKTKYKHIVLAIMIFFGLVVVISSVSACAPVHVDPIQIFELDNGHKIIKVDNKKCNVSWVAYRYSQDKNAKIMVYKEYKIKNKKGKFVLKSDAYFEIEKFKKKGIKVSSTYSTGPPPDQIETYKTNLSVKTFYLKKIKKRFINKIDNRVLSRESTIDKTKNVTVLYHDGYYYEDNGSWKHWIHWKTKTYTKFPNKIFIIQKYGEKYSEGTGKVKPSDLFASSTNYREYYYSYNSYISLEKIKKNKIKVTFHDLRKINGSFIKDRTYIVKTKKPLRKYYLKVFKTRMVNMVY